MESKYPYISGGGALGKAIVQFRKRLPSTIDADALKKLGLAPNNESLIINILRFIGIIQENGTLTEKARSVFVQHEDAAFHKAFAGMLQEAYAGLFAEHKEAAWSLDQAALVAYFRQANQTSRTVGTRQATTFQALAALAGHGEVSATRQTTRTRPNKPNAGAPKQPKPEAVSGAAVRLTAQRDFGLTVRIEINLPALGDQETYDRIFKSIRENLLNA